jgi:hydrophobic/amphiphilic exporter-1 (mainly G- bacteria), HAE1 family
MLRFILYRPVAMSMLALIILMLAFFFGSPLPVELASEVDLPRISIITRWQGASPEMMTSQITAKIESAASEVKGVKKINSVSKEGRSSVAIEFERGIKLDFAKLELSERLETLWQRFPVGVSRPILQNYVPKEFDDMKGFLTYQFYPKLSGDSAQIPISPSNRKLI